MTKKVSRIEDSKHILNAVCHSKGKTRRKLLEILDNKTIKAICDCCLNIVRGHFEITPEEKEKLRTHQKILLTLINKKISLKEKRKLIQKGGGFLLPLLAPVLAAFLGKVIK